MLNAGVKALFSVIKSRVFRYTFASKVVYGDTIIVQTLEPVENII